MEKPFFEGYARIFFYHCSYNGHKLPKNIGGILLAYCHHFYCYCAIIFCYYIIQNAVFQLLLALTLLRRISSYLTVQELPHNIIHDLH